MMHHFQDGFEAFEDEKLDWGYFRGAFNLGTTLQLFEGFFQQRFLCLLTPTHWKVKNVDLPRLGMRDPQGSRAQSNNDYASG